MATTPSLTFDVEDMLYGNAQIERPLQDTLSTQVTNAADVTWRFANYAMWKKDDRAERIVAAVDIGDATFDFTGGAAEDLWSLAAHGQLTGDEMYFDAVGTGAYPFVINTPYYFIYVAAGTFQLAATYADALAGVQVEGFEDSAGTWSVTTPAGEAGEIVSMTTDAPAGAADVTVLRAQKNTREPLPDAAIAAGVAYQKNPTYDRTLIQRFIHESVDMMLWPDVWYRTKRSLTWDNDDRYYNLAAEDFEVEQVYQVDLSGNTIGDAAYDFTGGGVEDEWTSAAHGLEVGHHVRFTVSGAGAAGYAIDTDYWVIAVPDANTFTLAAAPDGRVIQGTTDSTAAWTLEKRFRSFHPFPAEWWEVVTDSYMGPDYRALRLRRVASDSETVYYVAKTKPGSDRINDMPAAMASLVPWAACAMLLGGTRATPPRIDPKRTTVEGVAPSQLYADARYFLSEFERLKGQYKRGLLKEKRPRRRFVPLFQRSW